MRLRKFLVRLQKRRVRKKAKPDKHYEDHKEIARIIIKERLAFWQPLCEVTFKRVAIRNQRRRWGSCSSKGNLNFSYRLVFLPQELCDYVVVHELCHLKEMNHGPNFWAEVAKVLPQYHENITTLRKLEKILGQSKVIEPDADSYYALRQPTTK